MNSYSWAAMSESNSFWLFFSQCEIIFDFKRIIWKIMETFFKRYQNRTEGLKSPFFLSSWVPKEEKEAVADWFRKNPTQLR